MANIKSSQKKNRQRITHEAHNRAKKAEMRTAVKKLRTAIVAGDAKQARTLLAPAVKLIDRAGLGLLKKRTASRHVSRLVSAVNALK